MLRTLDMRQSMASGCIMRFMVRVHAIGPDHGGGSTIGTSFGHLLPLIGARTGG